MIAWHRVCAALLTLENPTAWARNSADRVLICGKDSRWCWSG